MKPETRSIQKSYWVPTAQACNPTYFKAEIRRIMIWDQPRQWRATLSQKYPKGLGYWLMWGPTECEAPSSNPSTTKKKKILQQLSEMAQTSNPSYSGSKGRWISSLRSAEAKVVGPYLKNQRTWLKWQSACLAFINPGFNHRIKRKK
jgi:hypothetical protein